MWLKRGHCLGLGNELEFGEGLIPVGLEKPEEGGLFSFAYLKKHTLLPTKMIGVGFPDSSVGRESVCNAGDPGSIPRLGRSTGKGLGYPPQYSWASLWAQLVKNLPAMQETWVYPWVGKIPGEGKGTYSSILAWRIPWIIYSPWDHKESDTTE